MKKTIILLCLLVLTFVTYSQSQYTPMTATGYQEKRLKVDSSLHIPSFCGVPTLRNSTAIQGALAMDTCNNKLYKWTRDAGWSEVAGGGGGSQDLQSVLDSGNFSYNKDINLYGRSSQNQIYLSGMDNNYMPFMALSDSIGGAITQFTYPQATIEFINKYQSQKLKQQDSIRATIYLPTQTIDATDTLAMLSDVRAVSGGTDTTSLSNRINQKVNISDTAAMLTSYAKTSAVNLKVNISDTAAMLTPYARKAELSPIDTSNKFVNSVTSLNDSTIRVSKGGTINDITIRSSATVTDATRLITAVYNNSGATITKGSVIYINGAHSSNLPTIALAKANTEETSAYTFGLVVSDITNNSQGTVVQNGSITNLNLPTSTYTDGQTLYLSPTVAGGYTLTKPLAPYHYVAIGTVTRAHPTLGTIQVAIRNGFQLDELSDVSIASVPADSTLLQFSRVDSLWHDVSVTSAIGTKYIKPTDTTSMLSGYAKTSAVNLKVNISDTATMLSKYQRYADSSAMLSKYMRKIDTATLSTRIDAKAYAINIGCILSAFAQSTTYYFGTPVVAASTTQSIRRIYIPQSGTIKAGYLYAKTTGATSTENWTLSIRLNATTSTTFATVANASTDKVFSNTALNIAVVAGDYIEITTATPAWSTAAGNTIFYGTLIIQ